MLKPFFPLHNGHIGIALRLALLSWTVTLSTLLIFVIITIPQQKRTYLQNLQSKANSVIFSLRDVAASAAVNEDYASLVSASQTLLSGDPDLEFLIIMKNNGFALLSQQKSWRVEENLGKYWRPEQREPKGQITVTSLADKRVFHFAQPFDYSGIQWGWIHVGLSLKDYNRTVATLYTNTMYMAAICIVFSFMASLLYARHLVKPILRLRHIMQQITAGDLSVRAEDVRKDELGSLAASVNSMTEALLRRDTILENVRQAAQSFLYSESWDDVINNILSKLGRAALATHVHIFINKDDKVSYVRYEWAAPGERGFLNYSFLEKRAGAISGMDEWRSLLQKNKTVTSFQSAPYRQQKFLKKFGIHSLIMIPVFVDGMWWGGIVLSDCRRERAWTEAERDSLRAVADMLGATITRQHAKHDLIKAKATLEERVRERTQELQSQVAAKEEALTQLAAAQSSLIEMSRSAGMAEVATGVLHNVGNVLNSVNVSCNLVLDQLKNSRIANVGKLAEILNSLEARQPDFLVSNPKGQQVPAYLESLGLALLQEHELLITESKTLHSKVEHIKEIVAMQQTYGQVVGIIETMLPDQLMEDALKLNIESLTRHNIKIERQYLTAQPLAVDKHKVLQILLNLINNAKHACVHNGKDDNIITLCIDIPQPGKIRMQVKDTGVGISKENMTRIFQHGFTTRKNGHGFGLHSGALTAQELGGSLSVYSEGPGLGAIFTLEIPNKIRDI